MYGICVQFDNQQKTGLIYSDNSRLYSFVLSSDQSISLGYSVEFNEPITKEIYPPRITLINISNNAALGHPKAILFSTSEVFSNKTAKIEHNYQIYAESKSRTKALKLMLKLAKKCNANAIANLKISFKKRNENRAVSKYYFKLSGNLAILSNEEADDAISAIVPHKLKTISPNLTHHYLLYCSVILILMLFLCFTYILLPFEQASDPLVIVPLAFIAIISIVIITSKNFKSVAYLLKA